MCLQWGGGGGGGRGYDSSHFLRTENSFGIIWSSPRQLRVKNTLRVGHRGPVGRKTTQKPPQNTKKWKKIVKKRLFSRFGHFGQNSDFSRKKSKTGIFFDITKPPLAQIYPKSGLSVQPVLDIFDTFGSVFLVFLGQKNAQDVPKTSPRHFAHPLLRSYFFRFFA